MVTGLAERRWTMLELLTYMFFLLAWVALTRRDRRPKGTEQPVMAVAAWPRLGVVLPKFIFS